MSYLNKKAFIETRDPSGYRYYKQHYKGDYADWTKYIQGNRISVEFKLLQEETKALVLSDVVDNLLKLSIKSVPASKLVFDLLKPNAVGRPKGSNISDEHRDNIQTREDELLESDVARIVKV